MPFEALTIGHSKHPLDVFLHLLTANRVEAVADTRTYPRSRFSPQYNREALRDSLQRVGIEYLFFGKQLGGRPTGAEFYDASGHVLYARMAESEGFKRGIEALLAEIAKKRVAILCAEENPSDCHRRLLITPALLPRGVAITHIRGDGRLEPESPDQLSLFTR